MIMEALGHKGYQKSILRDWAGAISVWDEAIKSYPKERKFYNNRSRCYFLMNDYKRALADAEYMTSHFPDYARGHFRHGEILASMGKFREAERCFRRVIELDNACLDAVNELNEVQIQYLCSLGFTRYQAGNAISMAKDLDEAKKLLREGAFPEDDGEVYESDEDTSVQVHPVPGHYDPLEDPDNPKKCCSIWVGNMKEKVSDDDLKKIFSKYGKVKSIKADFSKFFVFVNYVDPEGASKAMRQLQGLDLAGNKGIKIRYPDRAMTGK
ncbi:uncharacterized protein LOC113202549 [Frankliniella occidentalis]|uniref:Uncharacterized protein LOC113202549 n=1 Tax=Frankliniella occidentalis TaxID=133901 RepID=A0A6J1RUP8_FRAOC|nr:uncharacterized protein LOC113202549 [Frankliniella occidentalis]